MSGKRSGKNDPSEKHAQALRDLQARFADNKKCFECSQRGPTYVDTTIGSFVCSKCSGVLRGITPPHRIKSISMSSFSAEEIEYIKARGNSYNSKVWLGLYDKARAATDLKDEDSIRELIVQKYEKKRFYVDPSQITHTEEPEEIPRANSFTMSSPPSKFSAGLIGSTLLHKSHHGGSPSPSASIPKPISTPPAPQAHPSVRIPVEKDTNQEIMKWAGAISKPNPVQSVDPFASLVIKADNASVKPPSNPAPTSNESNFANFDAANFYSSPAVDPLNSSTANNSTSTINFSFSPLTPASASATHPDPITVSQKKTPAQKPIMSSSLSEDRYAALKDLDNIFKTSVELNTKTSSTPEPLPVVGPTNNGFGKNHNPFANDFNTSNQLNTSPWPLSASPGGPGFTSPSFGQNGAFGGGNSNGPFGGSSNGSGQTAANYFPSPWDTPSTTNSGSSNPNDFFSSKPFSNPWSESNDAGTQPFASQFGFNKKNPFL